MSCEVVITAILYRNKKRIQKRKRKKWFSWYVNIMTYEKLIREKKESERQQE